MPAGQSRSLEIAGHRGAPLRCVIHSGSESAAAVVLPGASRASHTLGGSPARPDLHYTRALLVREGLAVFEVWWDVEDAPTNDWSDWLDANVDAALTEASSVFRLALIAARSLGTWALARAYARHPTLADVPTVWLAPLLAKPSGMTSLAGPSPVPPALQRLRAPAFVAGGSNDPLFSGYEALLEGASGVDLAIVPEADHGLEVADPIASARLMAELLERQRAFIARHIGTSRGDVGLMK